MKKNSNCQIKGVAFNGVLLRLKKILIIMKLTTALLLIAMMNVMATGYSQGTFTFNMQNLTIKEIFSEIENQSQFRFFYNERFIDLDRKVDLVIQNSDIEGVMQTLLKSSEVTYKVLENNLIVITPKGIIQTIKITGVVSDEKTGELLPGVNIMEEGTTNGAISSFDGTFTVDVSSANSTLVFSFIGYTTQKIPVTGATELNIKLIPDVQRIDEVVVVGYGTMKKSDLTGSITSISNEKLTEVKSGNVIESLQGKIPGVDITRDNGRAGAGIDILVRGKRSLNASNAPLVIVDGIPYGDNIDINPQDIESIEILKDASSTAIYGSRGANGVILITTKRGKSGQSKIYFNSYYGISNPYQKVPMFDREGYIQAKIDANKDVNDWTTEPTPFNVFPGDELTGYENGTETNWQDVVTRTGARQDYHVGFMGGNENITYNTSLNYFNETGVVLADQFDRYTFKLNFDANVNRFIKVGGAAIITNRNRDGNGPRFTDAMLLSPIVPAYDSLGKYRYQPNFANPRKSPLATTFDVQKEKTFRTFSSFYAQLILSEKLSIRSNVGADIEFSNTGYMYPKKVATEGFTISGNDNYQKYNYIVTNILNYQNEFGKHRLNLTLGHEVQYNRSETYNIRGQEQDFDRSLWYNLGTNRSPTTSSSLRETALVSVLGRLNYNYNDKYLLNFSGRYDGASQLSTGNKWDFFPSVSGAWRMSNESFLSSIDMISDLKLRAGYGISGNAAVSPYSTAASLNIFPLYVQFGNPGAEVTYFGYRPDQLSSKTLRWERTSQVNIGLDFGLFKNRIVGNVDMYKSNSDRLLLSDKLPISSGFFKIVTNAGQTETEGLELSLQTINVDRGGFKWITNVIFFTSREKIIALASGIEKDVANSWFVGEPLDVIYGFEKLGIWQLDEADEAALFAQVPGDIKVRDLNNDDTINFDDRKVLGSPRAKWGGDFTNTISYKGIDLTFNIYAKMGQFIDADAYSFDPRMYDNQMEIDYWTPVNPTNDYPKLNAKQAEIDYEETLRYRDGSYIKLKNITLGYSFPKSLISRIKMSNLRIYASSNNTMILFSKMKDGIDPERGGSTSWPLARTLVFGISIEF